MKKRTFPNTLFKERDKSINTCALGVHASGTDSKGQYVLNNLSKREVEYLIWILADARKDMRYTKEQPRLFYDFEVDKVAARIGRKLMLERCPPAQL